MEKLILVTGGTGFLGAYLLRELLRKGYRVRAIKRTDSRMDLVQDIAERIEWVMADVTDIVALEEAFEGVTHVFHCAAMVSFHPRDARRMHQVNVDGTANVVNLCLDRQVQKLIHVSSIAALGRSKERPHLDEKSVWVQSPINTRYSVSKYQSEQEVWRGQAEGLSTAIVNPAMVLGAGFWQEGTARFFVQLNEGLKFCPVGCSGFVDARDVARFMVLLLERNIEGERFILNAENMDYKRFFHLVSQSLGKTPPPITVTPLLAEIAWRVEWLKEKLLGAAPMVTRESARSSVSRFTYDNKKSLTVQDFQYRPIETTIRDMATSFKGPGEYGKRATIME